MLEKYDPGLITGTIGAVIGIMLASIFEKSKIVHRFSKLRKILKDELEGLNQNLDKLPNLVREASEMVRDERDVPPWFCVIRRYRESNKMAKLISKIETAQSLLRQTFYLEQIQISHQEQTSHMEQTYHLLQTLISHQEQTSHMELTSHLLPTLISHQELTSHLLHTLTYHMEQTSDQEQTFHMEQTFHIEQTSHLLQTLTSHQEQTSSLLVQANQAVAQTDTAEEMTNEEKPMPLVLRRRIPTSHQEQTSHLEQTLISHQEQTSHMEQTSSLLAQANQVVAQTDTAEEMTNEEKSMPAVLRRRVGISPAISNAPEISEFSDPPTPTSHQKQTSSLLAQANQAVVQTDTAEEMTNVEKPMPAVLRRRVGISPAISNAPEISEFSDPPTPTSHQEQTASLLAQVNQAVAQTDTAEEMTNEEKSMPAVLRRRVGISSAISNAPEMSEFSDPPIPTSHQKQTSSLLAQANQVVAQTYTAEEMTNVEKPMPAVLRRRVGISPAISNAPEISEFSDPPTPTSHQEQTSSLLAQVNQAVAQTDTAEEMTNEEKSMPAVLRRRTLTSHQEQTSHLERTLISHQEHTSHLLQTLTSHQEQTSSLLAQANQAVAQTDTAEEMTNEEKPMPAVLRRRKMVKLMIEDEKSTRKAMEVIAGVEGVESVALKEKKITVIGEADPIFLTVKLSKFGFIDLLSVGPVEEEKKPKEKKGGPKKEEKKVERPTVMYMNPSSSAPYPYPYNCC